MNRLSPLPSEEAFDGEDKQNSTYRATLTFFGQKLWNTSLRNKLLIFLTGMVVLLIGAITTLNIRNSLREVEEDELLTLTQLHLDYNDDVDLLKESVAMLSASLSDREDIKELYLADDREGLLTLLTPLFETLESNYDIRHLYIEDKNGVVYVRVHDPDKYGDDVTYRRTAAATLETKQTVAGVEIGPNRIGIRSVSPLYEEGNFIGMLEVGLDYDQTFIESIKEHTGADYTMWISNEAASLAGLKPTVDTFEAPSSELFFYASTRLKPFPISDDIYRRVLQTGESEFQYASVDGEEFAVFVTPMIGYGNHIIGIVEISTSRTDVLARINSDTRSALATSGILLTLILVMVWFASQYLILRPLDHLTGVAQRQLDGNLDARVEITTGDEFEQLGFTFNSMTAKLRELLQNLEQRVAERTRNLELAAKVGRSVSQVRDLNVMLQEACDLIRKEFDLYYVQVYIVDPNQSTLVLSAGTGTVAAQLLEQRHRLQLNAGSINGRAAVEKRTVVISDTANSLTFRPNPLLPETRSEMAAPLIVGEKVVGVLDMQSNQPSGLNEEMLPAFEALAGQLAVAIQNAKLVSEAQQARAELEAQARRIVRATWSEHLDAIHKPEQVGFVFDQKEVRPLEETEEPSMSADGKLISAPISLTGEQLGDLVVEVQDESRTEQANELVKIVASQVAQQIENLRLLESAERYRLESEQAARRQTREGWQEYINTRNTGNLGYLFDLNEVRPYRNGKEDASSLNLPLKVRDEAIGKLSVQGVSPDDIEAVELANAVAERLSAHIESLRQYDQTQSALAQSERLFDASSRLTQATNLQELVTATIDTLGITEVNRALLTTFDYDAAGDIEQLTIIANWWSGTGHQVTPVGTRYPLEVIRAMPMFVSATPVFFNDTFDDERVDATTMELVKKLNLRAVAVLPLHTASRQLGALILEAEEPHNFTPEETRLFSSLAPQIATVVENRQQFEHAQHQAQRETMLNTINQKIQSATSVEAVLQIAARELGHALGAPMTIAQLSIKGQE